MKLPRSGGGWNDFVKWLAVQDLLRRSFAFLKTILKMKITDLPSDVKIIGLSPEMVPSSHKFHFTDKEFSKENIYKNFKAPDKARYKIVSFHGDGGISTMGMMLIAWFAGWRPANLDELLSVAEPLEKRFENLGLGDSFRVATFGTIVKRPSVLPLINIYAFCCPIVTFNLVEKEVTKEHRVSLHLHCLLNNCPPAWHVLFRIS